MELLPIGQFARLTGHTVRAIRYYGELGLLAPAVVDPETAYRYYTPDQMRDAEAIRRLRSLELPLDEIGEILAAADPAFTRARLIRHRAKMAELAAATEQILTDLQRLIEGEEELVPSTADIRKEVEVREVPEQPMLLIRDHAALDELSEVIPRAIEEVHGHMESVGAAFAGPPVVLYQAMHDDGTVDVATGWPVEGQFQGGGRVDYAMVPGGTMLVYSHRGPYDQLNRTHRALWELVEREGLTIDGAVREVYLTDPTEAPDPADWVTEIQMPIERDEARITALAGTSS